MTESPMQRMWGPLVEQGAENYSRARHLPALVVVEQDVLDDLSLEGTTKVVAALKKALNAMRISGLTEHWSYDMNRHIGLMSALHAEEKRLAHLQNCDGLAHIVQQAAE